MGEINFEEHGIDLYNQYFKKIDAKEKQDGYLTATEMSLFSNKPFGDDSKPEKEYLLKEQEFFNKYSGDDKKMTFEEFKKMCQDDDYRNNLLPYLGRGELSDYSLFETKAKSSDVQLLHSDPVNKNQNDQGKFFTTTFGSKVSGPINKILTEKSSNPEVIKLEEKMKKMGYNANFSDNLETAKIIVNAYEVLTARGYKMPKEVALMEATNDGILGFRPYSNKGNEDNVPILFNKTLTRTSSVMPDFLANIGIKHNATDSPESVIYHEIGHYLHEKSNISIGESIAKWKDLTNDGYDLNLAKEVGYYAMTGDKFNSGKEFVAEVFAGLMDGKHYSQRVMNIYYELGGPKYTN